MLGNDREQLLGGFVLLRVRAGGDVEDGVMEQCAGGIERDSFATSAEAGVDGEDAFLAEWRG